MADMVQIRRQPKKSYEGPDAKIGRSQFNRSHGLKMTFDASYLYPILVEEVLPGDTFTCKLNGFARIFSPLDAPVMDNIQLETFFFFVPNRILWDNWVYFQGEHDAAGAQDTAYTMPVLATGVTADHDQSSVDVHALAAYMGLPHGLQTANVPGVQSLPFRCYNKIYNEWFRDQNLTDELVMTVNNGPDTIANYALRKSSKKHDYMTSALPYLQKGTALTVSGAVSGDPAGGGGFGLPTFKASDGTPAADGELFAVSTATAPAVGVEGAWTADEQMYWNDPQLVADIDINALRQSVAIQRLLERDARGGTRYTEMLKAHFGVTSPDFRLQRPEYLGGGKAMINVSPVANTSDTATHDQGELAGIGTGVISGHGWSKSFTEHGWIMGLIRARGDVTYFQGLDRMWSRSTRYDFYIPALANLGEQSILNKEIWVSNSSSVDDAVFGYQERWSEYRQKQSRVVGLFNPDASGNIAHWHLAEDFSSLPALNTAFMDDNTPMARIQTVTTSPDFLLDVWFNLKSARPIPVYSIPALIGRF